MSLRIASLVIAIAIPTAAAAQPSGASSPYYQPAPGAPAAAQPVPRSNLAERRGLEIDIGLQAGNLSCSSPNDECDGFQEAGGIDLGATYMFTPKLGINAQVWGMAHSRDGWTVTQVISTVGVEFRPVPILSLQAGVGHAHATLSTDRGGLAIGSDDAFGLMLGAGIDVVRARNWAIDIHAKFGLGFYGDSNDDGEADVVARNLGLGAGFTYLF
jgi:hypothetical protein